MSFQPKVSAKSGVIIDKDTGAVIRTNAVYVPRETWEDFTDDSWYRMSRSRIIDIAHNYGEELYITPDLTSE